MTLAIIFLILGLGVLIFGAEILVRGSASMAKKWGISSIVIGLTVVAFGTSAPELIVNIISAVKGSADIAIGNIVGSNIANILLILGIASIIYPLNVKGNTVWKEIPFAILAIVLVYTMGNDMLFDGVSHSAITRTDGFSLIAIFIIFMFYIFALSKAEGKPEHITTYSWRLSIIMTVGGLVCLFLGGKLLVDNAIILARIAGMSEALIGLTIVAVGTSLPELATSIIAAMHHHDDIAVGNIVGSNIFNVFWILGLTGTMLQLPFNPTANIDVLVGVGATVLLFVFMFIGRRNKVDRWQGITFVTLYIIYTMYLIQRG
ncbi:MAG TPA: sodium:proton exchanger [Candidatus Magasanikbacteria bacterium]|nr:MAG: Na+/Ca+ antiporter, CaCA family [Parcubacteria group bacterium GW2011_GWF2_50_9]HAT03588.1 sodium:proton exchanger [Candidatus Magasanikbacteria bacterium]